MRVAVGTAIVMGLMKGKMDSPPTTAHFLIGEGCDYSCAYCSSKDSRIARIDWPEFPSEKVLASSFGNFGRVCLQLTSSGLEESIGLIGEIPLPVSVTFRAEKKDDVRKLFSAGADRVCIPLDACTPEISEKVCRGGFQKQLELLEWAAKEFPGKIASHLIIGLGETEREAVEVLKKLKYAGVYVGLFAFTPAKGSSLEAMPKPHIGAYRRVQIARYLIMNGYVDFVYNSRGQLLNLPEVPGEVFMTSGCPDCNRPYFDGSPSNPYNFPKKPTDKERFFALNQAKLYGGRNIFKAQKLIKVKVEYSNTIEKIKINGDFFLYPEDGLAGIEKNLIGCALEKGEIKARIEKSLNGFEAFGFDAESLTDAIMGAVT